jgi:hypothetical protein
MPLLNINIAGINVPIGDASNGLCGGMVFAVRDYFGSGLAIPNTASNPVKIQSSIIFWSDDYLIVLVYLSDLRDTCG